MSNLRKSSEFTPSWPSRLRRRLSAAWTDSFITFANVSGERDVAFAGVTRRFDVQYFAAMGRVSQAGDDTGFAGLEPCFANIFRRAEHFSDELRRDRHVLGLPARHLRSDTATDRTDLAFKLAHACFVRVIVDHAANRFLLEFALLGLESVFFQLPLDQIPLGDLEFLAFGVTWN